METFVVTESRIYECAEDVTDMALEVWLNPKDQDKQSGYLERGKDYDANGRVLTIINPEIETGDELWIRVLIGRAFNQDEYRKMLCDPQTWYNTSFGLYIAADALISLYKRDMALVRLGIAPDEKPKFYFSMIKPWLLLMAYAIENAAKGIIVWSKVKKNPSLKEIATLEDFQIKGHHIDKYLRRAFKAKNNKLGFLEIKLAEDLAAYSEFAGKYAIGIDYKNKVPNDLIMKSPSTTYFEEFYLETIIKLYEKIDFWLMADVQEAHPEFEEIRKWSQQFENELR